MSTNYPGAVNFQDAVTMEETLVVTGAVQGASFSGPIAGAVSATTLSASGLTKIPNPVKQQTITPIATQAGAPTIAELLGGFINHASTGGAGNVTLPTGTLMSGGISGVAIGSTFEWKYYNSGSQTATIVGDTDHTIVGGTAAVTTGKYVNCTSVCTAAHTWVTYLSGLL